MSYLTIFSTKPYTQRNVTATKCHIRRNVLSTKCHSSKCHSMKCRAPLGMMWSFTGKSCFHFPCLFWFNYGCQGGQGGNLLSDVCRLLRFAWQEGCAVCWHIFKLLGPVVQSVVSLTSLLRVISLTILADSIYNILIFFAEKTFFQQNFSIFAYHLMQILTNR